MATIWKYPLSPGTSGILMPRGARVLTVQTQRGEPCLWALVDPKEELERRKFDIVGTGRDYPDYGYERRYIGTFQLDGGSPVFHVFERTKV